MNILLSKSSDLTDNRVISRPKRKVLDFVLPQICTLPSGNIQEVTIFTDIFVISVPGLLMLFKGTPSLSWRQAHTGACALGKETKERTLKQACN